MSFAKDNVYAYFPDEMGNVEGHLSTDFEKALFTECFRTLEQEDSKLRLNHFSASLRELLRHVLERLSPDEEIRDCAWWQEARGDLPEEQGKPQNQLKIFRTERMHYAIHGGISPEYVAEIGIDIDGEIKELKLAHDQLSKYTHVNEQTFGLSLEKQTDILRGILIAFSDFFALIKQFREDLIKHLEERIFDAAVEQEMYETIPNVDLLASHYSTEEIYVEEARVVTLGSQYIDTHIKGKATFMLQWGSNSDVRNDVGAESETELPFSTKIKFLCSDPTKFEIEENNFSVDTSKWYEGRHDEEELNT